MTAPKNFKRWSYYDDLLLEDLHNLGVPHRQKAVKLERSYYAVTHRVRRLHLLPVPPARQAERLAL